MKLIFQSKTKLGELFSVIINTCLISSPSKSVKPSFIVRKRHIFQDRHGRTGSHRWILVHASDLLVSLVFFYPCDIFSIDQDLSGFYRNTSADDIQHRSFTRTVTSYYRYKFALIDRQIEVLKKTHLIDCTRIIIFVDISKLQHSSSPSSFSPY